MAALPGRDGVQPIPARSGRSLAGQSRVAGATPQLRRDAPVLFKQLSRMSNFHQCPTCTKQPHLPLATLDRVHAPERIFTVLRIQRHGGLLIMQRQVIKPGLAVDVQRAQPGQHYRAGFLTRGRIIRCATRLVSSHSGSEGCAPLGQGEGWFSMSLHRMPRCAVSSDNAHSCADDAALCRYSSGFSPVLRANQVGQLPTRRLRDWPRITQACWLNSRVLAIVITVYNGELRDGSAAFSASIHSCAALAVEAGMG